MMRTVLPTPAPPKRPIYRPSVGADEVDDFDPRFEDFCFRRLPNFGRAVDRPVIIGFDFGVDLVHGVAEDVEDTAQDAFPTGP